MPKHYPVSSSHALEHRASYPDRPVPGAARAYLPTKTRASYLPPLGGQLLDHRASPTEGRLSVPGNVPKVQEGGLLFMSIIPGLIPDDQPQQTDHRKIDQTVRAKRVHIIHRTIAQKACWIGLTKG